jgi:2-polyprenyl-3-methyl-5-hydroxy-6-metoxy-1,4-benzoquinol methylase
MTPRRRGASRERIGGHIKDGEALDLRAGRKVLDVAAGNGMASLAAARRWCDVTSTDFCTSRVSTGEPRVFHQAVMGPVNWLPKIGPVIALRRRTDYQSSPNWLSGAEDELSQPRFR